VLVKVLVRRIQIPRPGKLLQQLLGAGFDQTAVRIPWLGNKRLSLVFG